VIAALQVESYARAVKLDSFLAVAYFQMGVSNFLLGEFAEAMANFNEALLYLRGNTLIDYEQLGLKFKLYSCEVLFNRGLCYIYDQQLELGMTDLEYAAKEKQVEDHNVIDEAIKEQAEVCFCIFIDMRFADCGERGTNSFAGLHGLLGRRWRAVPTQ
jgi:tetratricopeptide (TPR) repeat protein